MFPFGQDIVYYFYPLVDDQPASISTTALQTQTPAIYVFTTRPSREAAAAGTGAAQTITSWTWDAERGAWSFTISAVSDPSPTSEGGGETYYVAVNFRLKVGGQTQTVVRTLDLERVTAHHRSVTVGENDLRNYYPQADAYSTAPQRRAYINQATEEVKARLRARGYEWSRLHRADRLNMVVTLKALAMLFLAQSQEANDKFYIKYQEMKASFESMLDSLKVEYDSDKDGAADSEAKAGGAVLLLR